MANDEQIGVEIEGKLMDDRILRIEDDSGTITAPDWAGVASLQKKLSMVLSVIEPLEQDKVNDHFKYRYTSYDEIAAAVRVAMAKAGLSLSVSVGNPILRVVDRNQTYMVRVYAAFGDSETGAQKTVTWTGEGMDLADKGLSKAVTNAVKFGLMRMFLTSSDQETPATVTRQTTTPRPAQSVARPAATSPATSPAASPTPPSSPPAAATPAPVDPAKPRHVIPPGEMNVGQKMNWMVAGFKLLEWDATHQATWLSKHLQVDRLPKLVNGDLDTAMALLFVEINPPAGSPAAAVRPDPATGEIPF